MSEKNKRLVDRFHMDIFVDGRLDVADEILTPDFVAHGPIPPEFATGPEGVKKWAASLRAGLHDMSMLHPHVVAEGDMVTIRWECEGTHGGDLLGVPASGRHVKAKGFDLFRIEDGMIAEMWQEWDIRGLMQQMGATAVAAAT